MNAFYEHHRDSIRFGYRCFDRILLNGLIQPFQQPERVVGFFATYRHLYPVSRDVLRGAAEQFQRWVTENAGKWNAPIVEAPKGRRDEFVDPYFKGAKPDQIVVILKAREPARIMTAIGDKKLNRWHLQIADRWIVQYNLYINDQRWGLIFVRMCPYLPFSARLPALYLSARYQADYPALGRSALFTPRRVRRSRQTSTAGLPAADPSCAATLAIKLWATRPWS